MNNNYESIEETTYLVHEESNHLLCEKIYQAKEKKFPLLALSIYKGEDGLTVSINKKEGAREYWENCDLPLELIEDFKILLEEAKEKLKQT